MRSIAPLVFAVLAASPSLSAETNLEKGKRIVNEALAALGGDKFLAMKDRTESGRAYSFYRERLTGLSIAKIYTRYYDEESASLKLKERQTFGKKEDIITLFDGTNGYQLTYRGAKPLDKERYDRYVMSTRRNILYILRERLKEPGLIIEYKRSEVFENAPVHVVDLTDSEDQVVTVMFLQSSHLPIRQIFHHLDPEYKERIEEVTRFTKYRDVDGVQWPFNMLRERNGEKIFEIFSDGVTINTGLTDDLFHLPAGTTVLPVDAKRPLTPLPSKTKEELQRDNK
jgi:hypothetical protein